MSSDHVVKVYDDDQDLACGVSGFVAAGIAADDLMLVVATPEHRAAFARAARAAAVDLPAASAAGQYLALDAREMLATFMVDGVPDPAQFGEVIGGLLRRAAPRRVRIFGEMVAVLWDEGNVSGAITLESLWNDLSTNLSFSLYCAYAMSSFASASDLSAIREVCDHHADVVAPESYTADPPVPSELKRGLSVSELFVPVPLAVRAVRRFVEHTLLAWGEDELLDDAAVVASELATNAVLHARSPFQVSLARGAATVALSVRDADRGSAEPRSAAPDTMGGRGLMMVAALCPSWGTKRVADGKVVWAELTPRVTERLPAG